MSEHWAHSAAIEMASDGVMQYKTNEEAAVFSPDDLVTREEFLVMVMKLLGTKDLGECKQTQFADDADILDVNKPYVQAAYRAGIIRGREDNGLICFCPGDSITRAESAVILNNIIGAEVPVNVSLFADNDSIPAWAQSALYALEHGKPGGGYFYTTSNVPFRGLPADRYQMILDIWKEHRDY
jgi:hypothetical protein